MVSSKGLFLLGFLLVFGLLISSQVSARHLKTGGRKLISPTPNFPLWPPEQGSYPPVEKGISKKFKQRQQKFPKSKEGKM